MRDCYAVPELPADLKTHMWSARVQVFGRGAKFSMFKPAEEMVYIGLDTESRTKGKAAIDVVGAQTGKSLGAIVQQVGHLASDSMVADLWACETGLCCVCCMGRAC